MIYHRQEVRFFPRELFGDNADVGILAVDKEVLNVVGLGAFLQIRPSDYVISFLPGPNPIVHHIQGVIR